MNKPDHLPEAPKGWQYGVVMKDGKVWGCGDGEDGRVRQRMRLRYVATAGPCLIGPTTQEQE